MGPRLQGSPAKNTRSQSPIPTLRSPQKVWSPLYFINTHTSYGVSRCVDCCCVVLDHPHNNSRHCCVCGCVCVCVWFYLHSAFIAVCVCVCVNVCEKEREIQLWYSYPLLPL